MSNFDYCCYDYGDEDDGHDLNEFDDDDDDDD